MEHLEVLVRSLCAYMGEIFIPVLLGFLFSGIIHEFVSDRFVQKYFGNSSTGSVFTATWIGVLLPVCCVGSLPIAVTLHQKGARLGPILAFLVATPATSAPAIFVCWKLMGFTYTVFMVVTVIVMGLITGIVGNTLKVSNEKQRGEHLERCCDEHKVKKTKNTNFIDRVINVLEYAWIELPRKIGSEILIGAVVASVIVSFEGVREFVRAQLSGFKGYLLLVVIGLVDYVCSTASVPVADALTQTGVSYGKSMVYLLMGPITSYATILVIRKEFGYKVLAVYLTVIAGVSVGAGRLYDIVFASNFPG